MGYPPSTPVSMHFSGSKIAFSVKLILMFFVSFQSNMSKATFFSVLTELDPCIFKPLHSFKHFERFSGQCMVNAIEVNGKVTFHSKSLD